MAQKRKKEKGETSPGIPEKAFTGNLHYKPSLVAKCIAKYLLEAAPPKLGL